MTDPIERTLNALAAVTGHNGGMPSRREFSDGMPDPARAAHQAIAGPARLEAVRFLLAHPASTRSELVNGTGVSTNAGRVALEQLEDLGYVTADVPADARNGRTVRYTADRQRLTADLAALLAYVVG